MNISEFYSCKDLTTFKVGGFARYVIDIKKVDDLIKGLIFAQNKKLPIIVLGGGSNTFFADKGFKGVIFRIKLKSRPIIKKGKKRDEIIISAGEQWDNFVKFAINSGYKGLENLSGIPGLVGAAPIQNIGAYGVEVAKYIKKIECFDIETKKLTWINKIECNFSYRNSFFKTKAGKRKIITKVAFSLPKNGKINIKYRDLENYFKRKDVNTISTREVRQAVLRIRKQKFPNLKEIGTGGSFYKNPIISEAHLRQLLKKWPALPFYPQSKGLFKVSIAWILDNILNTKGIYEGNVGCFEKQPLVIVAKKNATAKEIDIFTKKIAKKVFQKTKIKIEREVLYVK